MGKKIMKTKESEKIENGKKEKKKGGKGKVEKKN